MTKRQNMIRAVVSMVFVIGGMSALAAAFMALFMAVGDKLERAQSQPQSPTDLTSLMADEGFRGNQYTDTRGFGTIGYGTKLPISKAEGELLLRHRLNAAIQCIAAGWPPWEGASERVREALSNAGYVLGCKGLLEFKQALGALARGDLELAAADFRASKWYREEPHRVDAIIARLLK